MADQQATPEEQATLQRDVHRQMLLGAQAERISMLEHQAQALSQELEAVVAINARLQAELNLWHRAFERPCPECHAGLGPEEIAAEPHAEGCPRAVTPEELRLPYVAFDHPFARVAMTEQQIAAAEADLADPDTPTPVPLGPKGLPVGAVKPPEERTEHEQAMLDHAAAETR